MIFYTIIFDITFKRKANSSSALNIVFCIQENCYAIQIKLSFMQFIVRNGEFFSSFCSPSCQNSTSVNRRHALAKSMFVASFSYRRLKCSFHCSMYWECKIRNYFYTSKIFLMKFSKIEFF